MAWNKRGTRIWAIATLALFALPIVVEAPPFSWAVIGTAAGAEEQGNFTLVGPAYLYLAVVWDDGERTEPIPLDSLYITLTFDPDGVGGITAAPWVYNENPMPVPASVNVIVKIQPKSANEEGETNRFSTTIASGAAGEYRYLEIAVNDTWVHSQRFLALKVIPRLYDSTTGAGLPFSQFNVTVQFPPTGPGGDYYAASDEIPVGLGYFDSYYNITITLRVRDYFGNLLYNSSRLFTPNFTSECYTTVSQGAAQCPPWLRDAVTWDVPLTVYSFKVYNQKPDQFIKVKLYWNGSGAGEEVFAPNSGLFPPWWDSAYTYRERIRVTAGETPVFTNYSLNLSLLASSLTGKMQADYRDLRVLYWNGSAWTELGRSYDGTSLYWPAQGGGPMPDIPSNGSWHFDEGTGTSAVDSSGNGGTGTLQNGPTWVTDRYGVNSAVSLDGSNDYVSVPHSTATNIVTSGLTIETWIHPTAVTGARQLVSKAVGVAAGDRKYGLYLNAGALGFEVRTSSGTVDQGDTSAVPANTWTHVAGTYDGVNMRWYVNGVQTKITGQTGAIVSNTQDVNIGRFPTGVSFFQGYIGDVRIYEYARSAAEIACDARVTGCVAINASTVNRDYFVYYGNPLAGSPPSYTTYRQGVLTESSVKAYWTLDESSGTTAVDVSGNGNNGAVTGAVIVNGKVVLARDFDGVDDRISTGTGANKNNDFTIEAWVRVSSSFTHASQGLVQWGDETAGERRALILWNGGAGDLKAYFSGFGGPANVQGDTKMNTGAWRHVAVTLTSGNVASVYVDGILENTASVTLAAYTNNVVLLGDTETAGEEFEGDLDEVAVYHSVLPQATIVAHFEKGIGQNSSATVALDSSQGFEWFQSPTETVERFLNPGYYQLQIVTDNRTGVQTKANLGVNITEANYYMVSGTNITRFVGDFNSIFSQTQIIANAFRPDVIEYGEQLPTAPTVIHAMSVDEEAILIHPFSVLTGSTAYTGAAGTNVTSFQPAMSSESSNDGSLLTSMTVLKDQFVFSGTEPALTHVWINYTSNGTNIWENATLPPFVTLSGIQGDVYVVTNRSVQTTRISDFRAVWEFSFAYYATTKRYEASLSLNNTMNRTVYNPYWYVGFPENRSINISSAAVKDLDNNVWLTPGQHFEVAQGGYYLTFDGLNASATRRFFFQFFDLNSTQGQSTLIRQVSSIARADLDGSTAFWVGEASFSHEFAAPYRGDLVVKFTCSECTDILWETVVVIDTSTGRRLDTTEFLAGGGSVTITGSAVGELGVGEVRNYKIYFKLELDPAKAGFSVFAPLLVIFDVPISLFLLTILGAVAFGVMATMAKDLKHKQFWLALLGLAVLAVFLMYVGRPEGRLGFVP